MSSSKPYPGGIEAAFPLVVAINKAFWAVGNSNSCHGAAVFPDGFGCGGVVSIDPKVPDSNQPGGENVVLSIDKSGGTGFAFVNAQDAQDALAAGGAVAVQALADSWTPDPLPPAPQGGGLTAVVEGQVVPVGSDGLPVKE